MKVRCYFRNNSSTNNVGRVDVDMDDAVYGMFGPEEVYGDAICEVKDLLAEGAFLGVRPTVLAVVNNA